MSIIDSLPNHESNLLQEQPATSPWDPNHDYKGILSNVYSYLNMNDLANLAPASNKSQVMSQQFVDRYIQVLPETRRAEIVSAPVVGEYLTSLHEAIKQRVSWHKIACPEEISKLLEREKVQPTPEGSKSLKEFLIAYDTLIVQERIAEQAGLPGIQRDQLKSAEDFQVKAAGFRRSI